MQDQSQLFCASVVAVTERSNTPRPRQPALIAKRPSKAKDELPDQPRRVTPGPSRQKLAAEIRAFLQETGMYQTPFGIAAAQDDKLLWRLERAPKGISLDKADRIRAFMEEFRQTSEDQIDAPGAGDRQQGPPSK